MSDAMNAPGQTRLRDTIIRRDSIVEASQEVRSDMGDQNRSSLNVLEASNGIVVWC